MTLDDFGWRPPSWVALLATCVALFALLVPADATAQRALRLGVVYDGDSPINPVIRDTFEAELDALLSGGDVSIEWVESSEQTGNFDAASAEAALDAALALPEVDVVLALGPIVGSVAAHRERLPLPVIAPFLLNPEWQGVSTENGRSGVRNLNFVAFRTNVERELAALAELAEFEHVAFLLNAGVVEAIPGSGEGVIAGIEELGYRATIVPVGASPAEVLAQIPDDVDAAYVTPLMIYDAADVEALAAGLIERGIPSVTVGGREDVERGLLLGVYPDGDWERIARRAALNIEAILWGDAPETLPVSFSRGEAFTLNMATAEALGVYPSWAVLTEAERVGRVEREVAPGDLLDPDAAVREALESNLQLLSARIGVEADAEAIRQARAALLPGIDFGLSTRLIDRDRARAGFGSAPQWALTPTLSLEQLVWAEGAHANRQIQEALQRSREHELDALELDIVAETLRAYVNVLRAKTLERIELENLASSRSHLDLAELRENVGTGRASEVLRWESEIATNQRNVISANAQRNQAEIALNVVLRRDPEADLALLDPTEAEEALQDPQVDPYLSNPWYFDIFRDFLTLEAIADAPELDQLDEAIAAQERALRSRGAAFWSPNVVLAAETAYTISAGEGTESGLTIPGVPASEGPDDWTWQIALALELPLYAGGERDSLRDQAALELMELEAAREQVHLAIEQRVRSVMHAAGASRAGIPLAEDSVAAALENLEIVESAYASGAVSIIDLLDAQTAALVAQQLAANARYDALLDFIEVQRAVSWFQATGTEDERADFFARAAAYFAEHAP